PIFNVAFTFQNFPVHSLKLQGLTWQAIGAGETTAKFDISLTIRDFGHHLSGAIEYCTDLFEPATISRMIQHYLNLIESILLQPEAKIADLRLLSPEEEDLLAQQIN